MARKNCIFGKTRGYHCLGVTSVGNLECEIPVYKRILEFKSSFFVGEYFYFDKNEFNLEELKYNNISIEPFYRDFKSRKGLQSFIFDYFGPDRNIQLDLLIQEINKISDLYIYNYSLKNIFLSDSNESYEYY